MTSEVNIIAFVEPRRFHFYPRITSQLFNPAAAFTQQSHNGSYISAAKNGDVSCTVGDPTEENEFQIECSNDGKWAIKSAAYSRYFGGSGSSLRCYENQLSSTLLWTVQLSMHPQVIQTF